MCGRYSLDRNIEDLITRYRPSKSIKDFARNDEVFPTDSAPVVLNKDGKVIARMSWGFKPSYAKQPLINARAETVNIKATFKNSFLSRRCLIPISSFYEWQNIDGKKLRRRISIPGQDIISLAGLYDAFKDKEGNQYIAFTIITTEALGDMKDIHHRMPLIIDREMEDLWLDNQYEDISKIKELLKPYSGEISIV